MTIQRTHIIIYGRVQGVFFRQSTFDLANNLELTGFVRNKSNGSVEAVFEGNNEKIKEMIQWCHHGPPYASVQGIEIVSDEIFENKEGSRKYSSFSIESTL